MKILYTPTLYFHSRIHRRRLLHGIALQRIMICSEEFNMQRLAARADDEGGRRLLMLPIR